MSQLPPIKKKTLVCDKCQGTRFLVNERVGFAQKVRKAQGPETRYVAALPVIARKVEVPGSTLGPAADVEELGTYQSVTCIACGYTELYAMDIERAVHVAAGRIVG